MIMIGAGNVARATSSSATKIKRFMHCPKNQRMLSHAEIVVGTPHADGLCSFDCMMLGPWKRSSLPLKIREDAVTTFGAQLVKLSVEEVAVNHCISCQWLALASAKRLALPKSRRRFDATGILSVSPLPLFQTGVRYFHSARLSDHAPSGAAPRNFSLKRAASPERQYGA